MNTKDFLSSLDSSTLAKRRKAVAFVVDLLDLILDAEEAVLDGIPENLQGGDAFAYAESRRDAIAAAIDELSGAYLY